MTQGPTPTHTLEETLAVFDATETVGTPLTTSEVADTLDCARRTAYGKLEALADDGVLETKKVGARGRVWWRPGEQPRPTGSDGASSLERTQFHELVETITDYAIFVLDPDGRVQTWNEGAKRAKGYEAEEITGEHVSTFYTEADQEVGRPETNLEAARENGRTEDEGWRVRKDGSRFWANVTITALRGDDGELRGFTKVTRDMTERHDYEERLREQRDELDELNQINTVIREIDQALVTATSREAIEQAVCDRLAASDTYTAAWTAEYTEEYDTVTARTAAGIDAASLDAMQGDDATIAEVEAGVTALETQTTQPVRRLGMDDDRDGWRDRSPVDDYESAIAVPLVYNDVEYGTLTVYADHASALDQRKIDVLDELGETISHAIAAVRRKEREQTLTALQQSTRELLHAETHEEIGDVIVDTLTEELSLDDALVYHFDATENTLESVSSSVRTDVQLYQSDPLGAGTDSPVWESFVTGETQVEDVTPPSAGEPERRGMVVPLGDHGVLAVAKTTQEAFSANTQNLVELVAATAEAAFDRVENQATLHERDELLQQQNQRLQRVNQISTIIRDVDQGLVQATTRDEIQRVVCDRLTRSDHFRFAWLGTPDGDGALTPAAQSGRDRGYLDSVDRTPSDAETAEPAVAALRDGDATVVPNVADDLRAGAWRREAFSREFQSVISVPLSYGDVTYGVLSVYADRPDVFEEMEQSVFVELGETIANAINAVETKRALLADQLVELDFRLRDDSSSVLSWLARRLDCSITFEGGIPLSDGRVRTFFVANGVSSGDVDDALDAADAVESSRILSASDDGVLVEAVVGGPSIARALTEYGASLQSLTRTGDGVQLTVHLPASVSVREFVEWFQERYERTEFVARRERGRAPQTRESVYSELEETLTDRQYEVLKTAYYSGFFLSPRQSTGTDVAEMLGVSQPTVSEQLRAAQRKVLGVVFDGGTTSEAA